MFAVTKSNFLPVHVLCQSLTKATEVSDYEMQMTLLQLCDFIMQAMFEKDPLATFRAVESPVSDHPVDTWPVRNWLARNVSLPGEDESL